MEAFVSRKRRKISKEVEAESVTSLEADNECEDSSTDEKLAILLSVFEDKPQDELLEVLLAHEGSVENAIDTLLNATSTHSPPPLPRKTSTVLGVQSSLNFRRTVSASGSNVDGSSLSPTKSKALTKKGKTLYLYSPSEISKHTPCTIIHNFLPSHLANELLKELLPETESYSSATFRLFDNVVRSPHKAQFYVGSLAEAEAQKSDYLYNGSTLGDVREILPYMRQVSALVHKAVNAEIEKRIKTHFPGGKKLRYQPPPGNWIPNAAFVNCYDGGAENVGWHTDQLTYLGPHPTIGSLSLGVQREFRIRRIVPPPDTEGMTPSEAEKAREEAADAQGQISIPLPHNSLLLMHADMQETWKHSVAPAPAAGGITPHPIAGKKRLNVTYRWYRKEFEPKYTQRCRCVVKVKRRHVDAEGKKSVVEVEERVPCVLKSIMKRKETRGRYVWMCQTPGRVPQDPGGNATGNAGKEDTPGGQDEAVKGCGFFEWAEFDDDGVPLQISKHRADEKRDDGAAQTTT